MDNKAINQHYYNGQEANWQEQRRRERRLQLVPNRKVRKQSLRLRLSDWWDNHLTDILDSFGLGVLVVMFFASLCGIYAVGMPVLDFVFKFLKIINKLLFLLF